MGHALTWFGAKIYGFPIIQVQIQHTINKWKGQLDIVYKAKLEATFVEYMLTIRRSWIEDSHEPDILSKGALYIWKRVVASPDCLGTFELANVF
jgi:hypothetical protein